MKKLLFVTVQLIFMALVFACADGKREKHAEGPDAGTSCLASGSLTHNKQTRRRTMRLQNTAKEAEKHYN